MKKYVAAWAALFTFAILISAPASAFSIFGKGQNRLEPQNGAIRIPLEEIDDGKAHHYTVAAEDGTVVTFFTLKSSDGVIRAAVDACDVCYRSGKGYVQEGDHMVCQNCGRRFPSERINVVKGGCNPAPLERTIEDGHLVIAMQDINTNAWYCELKPENR